MPGKRLPDKKVEMLLRAGKRPKEIRDILLSEDYIEVTPEAITMWRKRRGIEAIGRRHATLIPWRVAERHNSLYPAKMLRLEGRRRGGDKLSDSQLDELQRWKDKLAANNLVVHYERETVTDQGFFYVPRRAGVDTDLFRDPAIEGD